MPKKIFLTQNQVAVVDNNDYKWLAQYKWCAHSGRWGTYAVRNYQTSNGRCTILMHREIMNPLPEFLVDHIDHNTLNNQRCNLRIVTARQSSANCRKSLGTTSRYKGVSRCTKTGKWVVHIRTYGKCTHLGQYTSEYEAAIVYDTYARKYFGSCAHLNFPYQQHDVFFKPRKLTSSFRGVYWNNQLSKWSSSISFNRERFRLGYFESELDAALAYKEKALELNLLERLNP